MNAARFRVATALVGLAIGLGGCVSFTRDVSDDRALWGRYDPDRDYQLLRDVFLIREDSGLLSKRLVLAPEGSLKRLPGRHYAAPWSIDDYRRTAALGVPSTPGRHAPDVVGILPAGTRFHCTLLDDRRGWTFMTGSFRNLTPWATIIEGSFAGSTVDITDISVYYRENPGDVFRYRPEAGVVALVGGPQ